MSLWNPFALDVLGQPMAAVAPPALRVEGGQASPAQLAMAQQAFARFVSHARLSQAPNPTQIGKLADGTAYRIVSVAGQQIMQIWPAQDSRSIKVDSGIVFSRIQSGEIWLLINELVDGRPSANWVFRNIAKEYSAPEKSNIFSMQGMTERAIAVPGGWGYSYTTQGLGRFGYLNVFNPLRTGEYTGELMHVTPSGTAVFVNTSVYGERTMRQSVLTKNVSDLSPPPFGSNAQTNVVRQDVPAVSQALSVDTPGFLDTVELYPLPNPLAREFHVVSPNGKYLAVVVERYTGQRKNIVGPLVYAPDSYQVQVDLWPQVTYTRGTAFVRLDLQTLSYPGGPAEYETTEQVIKAFRAGNSGYEPVADVVLASHPRSLTPTIARVVGGLVRPTYRAGFSIPQQVWQNRLLISSAVFEGGTKWRVFATHNSTNSYALRKASESGTSQLIGMTDSGEYVIQEDKRSMVYEVDYSRPTDSHIEVISFQDSAPMAGDLVSADISLVNNESGSFEAKFKGHSKNLRKYSIGPEIITSERYVEGVKTGTFYQNNIRGEEELSTSVQVQYTSRVATRQVVLQRLMDGLLVYYEHSAELTHQSSAVFGGQGTTENHSTALPQRSAKVTIWYRGVETTFPIEPGSSGYPGYANLGTNITAFGEVLRASQNMLSDTDPIGGWGPGWVAKYGFISTDEHGIVEPLPVSSLPVSAVCAKCPQTPGMLLEIAAGTYPNVQVWRFLVDPVAGVRDAESALEWPQAAKAASFYPF